MNRQIKMSEQQFLACASRDAGDRMNAGVAWRDEEGRGRRATWIEATGELYLVDAAGHIEVLGTLRPWELVWAIVCNVPTGDRRVASLRAAVRAAPRGRAEVDRYVSEFRRKRALAEARRRDERRSSFVVVALEDLPDPDPPIRAGTTLEPTGRRSPPRRSRFSPPVSTRLTMRPSGSTRRRRSTPATRRGCTRCSPIPLSSTATYQASSTACTARGTCSAPASATASFSWPERRQLPGPILNEDDVLSRLGGLLEVDRRATEAPRSGHHLRRVRPWGAPTAQSADLLETGPACATSGSSRERFRASEGW